MSKAPLSGRRRYGGTADKGSRPGEESYLPKNTSTAGESADSPDATTGYSPINRLRNVPILEDDLILLRPVKASDADDMFEYGSDIKVVKYLPWGPYRSIEEVREGIEKFFLTRPEQGLPAAYAIVWKQTGKMIGTCDFHSVSEDGNSGGIGFVLNRGFWNQGIITKAAKMLIDMGRRYLGFSKITLDHVPANAAAARIAEKLGFRNLGLREHRFMVGQKTEQMVHHELNLT